MTLPAPSLEDTVFRLLETAPRGLTVERIRSQLVAAGAASDKHEIVRALGGLRQRRMVQMDASRRWKLHDNRPRIRANGPAGIADLGDNLFAVPCRAFTQSEQLDSSSDQAAQEGIIEVGIDLLVRLLPYYQECLRTGDGGSPRSFASKYGEQFSLLQPDKPWWPTAERGRSLVLPLSRLQPGIRSRLVRQSNSYLLVGYPLHIVPVKNPDRDTLIRPVWVFRCRYRLTDGNLTISIPVTQPTINHSWLRDQANYGGWNASRLLSWLLFEDDKADLNPDEDHQTREFLDIPNFAERLTMAVGTAERQPLLPEAIVGSVPLNDTIGYYNGLAVFPDIVGRYARTAISDYDRLCREPPERVRMTALGSLFGESCPSPSPVCVVHPFPLGETQLLATRSGLSSPLTVVTGPPGTGKSQVIAALMLSASAAGRSVLLAARQHRSIDAVQERLEDLTGDRKLLVRANDSDGAGRFDFEDAMKALLTRPGDVRALSRFQSSLSRISTVDSQRWEQLGRWRNLKHLVERQVSIQAKLDTTEGENVAPMNGMEAHDGAKSYGLFQRILRALLHMAGPSRMPDTVAGQVYRRQLLEVEKVELKATLNDVEADLRKLKSELEAEDETPVTLGKRIEDLSRELIELLLDRFDVVSPEDRRALAAVIGDTQIFGQGNVDLASCRLVLKHMPLWAVTTLAAGSRIPFEPGLFDYVVFDEASVTDIASSLPLLYRGKAAVVVGDPMQLGMISKLGPQEERSLLSRHGLFQPGIGQFAQGQTDLFQLAASSIDKAPILLNEHYRCHPDIAAYFNEAFYGRKLTLLTEINNALLPKGLRPGLHWTHVEGEVATGREIGTSGSAYSVVEAEAIVGKLEELLALDFPGTVGIVAFFAPQAKYINELASKRIGADDLSRLNVKIFTTNRFQGDERDIILLSLCLAPNMPSGALNFLMRENRLLNVAVSRARIICHVIGNKSFAAISGIPHIEALVRRVNAASIPRPGNSDDRFDSPWEKHLHDAMVDHGLEPMVQHPVAGRFLDLAIVDETKHPPLRLDIEVDGVAYHTDDDGNRLETDLWRDYQLKALGWKILRFWVHELRDDLEGCLDRIDAAIRG